MEKPWNGETNAEENTSATYPVQGGKRRVSLFALQLAAAHGARVLVTSRSTAKIARLKQLGGAEVIDTSANTTWDEVVLRLTDGRGADHVLDVIGGDPIPLSIQAAACQTRMFGGSWMCRWDFVYP
jgi:NADPH:quinone reductase-like Zn-dependent oxidoreductase